MANPEGVPSVQEVRSRSVRGYIVFAFAVGLVLLTAYLMREILLLLYVSALFAVVFTPLIRGIMRLHVMQLASQPRAGDPFPAAQRGRRHHPVFCFCPAPRIERSAVVDFGTANARPPTAPASE